jgi:hypothetical protein
MFGAALLSNLDAVLITACSVHSGGMRGLYSRAYTAKQTLPAAHVTAGVVFCSSTTEQVIFDVYDSKHI